MYPLPHILILGEHFYYYNCYYYYILIVQINGLHCDISIHAYIMH